MRQPNWNCVANFLSPRLHGQGSELPSLSAGADQTDGEIHIRTALHPAKQVLDLFDRVHARFAHLVNDEPTFNSRFFRGAAWFDRGNENPAALRVTERVT